MTTKMDRLTHFHRRGSVWSATGHHVSLAQAVETPKEQETDARVPPANHGSKDCRYRRATEGKGDNSSRRVRRERVRPALAVLHGRLEMSY